MFSFMLLRLKVTQSQIYLDGKDPWAYSTMPATSNVQRPNCTERPPRPTKMGEGIWGLVNDCWEKERRNRPDIQMVVEKLKCMPDSGYDSSDGNSTS
jgi:hypothetical protein